MKKTFFLIFAVALGFLTLDYIAQKSKPLTMRKPQDNLFAAIKRVGG